MVWVLISLLHVGCSKQNHVPQGKDSGGLPRKGIAVLFESSSNAFHFQSLESQPSFSVVLLSKNVFEIEKVVGADPGTATAKEGALRTNVDYGYHLTFERLDSHRIIDVYGGDGLGDDLHFVSSVMTGRVYTLPDDYLTWKVVRRKDGVTNH